MSYRNYSVANGFIVDPLGNGDFKTIGAALTSSSSGKTIFIRPGTYTENLTLIPGVNLTAFPCDSSLNGTGNVIIRGTCTLTVAGSVTISGIQLQTNSAALLAVTGSAASIVNLNNCFLNCSNNTGITFSSSSASARISINNCQGDTGTTGIAYWAHSSAGQIRIRDSFLFNTGASSTANTVSAGSMDIFGCEFNLPITTSSTGAVTLGYVGIVTSTQNVTSLTSGGAGDNAFGSYFSSGTASAISISTNLTLLSSNIISSNTNAITGAGSLIYAGLIFPSGTQSTINVTTQSGGVLEGGRFQAPSVGFIGEQIRANLPTGSALSLSSATPATFISINLTAGIWDISLLGTFVSAASTTSTAQAISISPTNNVLGATPGDDGAFNNYASSTGFSPSLSVPAFRVTLTANATYYAVAQATFAVSTMTVYGRISATRVG